MGSACTCTSASLLLQMWGKGSDRSKKERWEASDSDNAEGTFCKSVFLGSNASVDSTECILYDHRNHSSVLLQIYFQQWYMDVQRTVPYRNPGSGSGNLHLLTVDQEIRKKKYRICRWIYCTWRPDSVFPESIQLRLHGYELCHTCHRTCSTERSCIQYGWWCSRVRTVEKPYPSGKSDLCRRFHRNKSWRRSCLRSDHRSFKQFRICKLICRNNCTAGNSTGDDRFSL